MIASIAPTPETRQRADFTDPYYRTPARFVARLDSPIDDVLPERLEGKKIAVVAGTAHEAYLKAMFTEAEVRAYPNAEAARAALRNKDVDLLFGDGIALAFWLNGADFGGCCVFRGGPFLESRFFGEGIGIAVKRGNDLAAARPSTGRCSGCGRGAASPICGCAISRSARFDHDPIRRTHITAHSRASGNPRAAAKHWVPAFAGTSGMRIPDRSRSHFGLVPLALRRNGPL